MDIDLKPRRQGRFCCEVVKHTCELEEVVKNERVKDNNGVKSDLF